MNNSSLEALPSYWKGTVFRSRTEARWAVFFDAVKLRWEYEPEGYCLPDGTWYLPDFWLPDLKLWAEVKPGSGATAEERTKIEQLVRGSGSGCLLLDGAPWPRAFDLCEAFDLPEATPWGTAHFSDTYTVHKRDSSPRLFHGSRDYEAKSEEDVQAAMATARRMDLKEPDAGDYLPLGWEGMEPAWTPTDTVEFGHEDDLDDEEDGDSGYGDDAEELGGDAA